MTQHLTSPKLEALQASLATAINFQHEQEIKDDIQQEKEHLRTCPFAKGERNLDKYRLRLKVSADIIDATAMALGIPKSAENKETILKAIEDLKTAATKAQAEAGDPLRWRCRDHSALAQVFGLRPECSVQNVLDAAKQAQADASKLTGLAIDRGDALDRLLSILKAPLHYGGGEPLTQEERIEWAIRRAPKA